MGMRNVIAHEYFGLDREIVARTVRESLPPLRVGIERLLHELGEG